MASGTWGPHHITDDDQGPLVTIIASLMMVYMIFCYLARLLTRFSINGPFGSDDWVITIGTVSKGFPIFEASHYHVAARLEPAHEEVVTDSIFRFVEVRQSQLYIRASNWQKFATALESDYPCSRTRISSTYKGRRMPAIFFMSLG
ncbi:hypothetical protein ACJ73_06976 [Blastomyces percursus]|uniref:Uncharacterized protein n=1 Tax=Blastomyces percursus TaxID=1658174 RepID=A0A1J9Q0P0_9EURO|nr:hypothetical protein ACJ73_06976 [Blastomyces percursus]